MFSRAVFKSREKLSPSLSLMNVSNLSAPSPATRELKPLHPFLRFVALFLAVALTFTGPVPIALAATTASVTVTTSGSLSITNLAQSGTILTVGAGGSLADGIGITLATGTLTGGTLSLTSLIFSGTSSFQNKDVNLSVLSNLQLAAGGSLTVPNGMSISYGPTSGVLLGGGSAVINAGSSATQGGMVGASGGEIRVDNVSTSRSTLTVNTGTVTADTISAAYLDLGAKLDLLKNGRGLLGLNALNSPVNGGSLSVFSGTITATAGTLLLGDNFLSDGTSNSLKIIPASSSTSFPVIVALQGSAFVSSLLTSGGSASNVILGVSTDATSGELVVNNVATDNSIFKGVLADAVDGTPGFQMSVVKNGEGSLLLSNASSSFTGGLTLNAGSLIVNADSSTSTDSDTGTTVISGPLGGGALNLRGGTLFVQPPYSYDLSDPLNPIVTRNTSILLHNQVSFFQLTDSDVAAGGSLVIQRKATFASANGTDTLTLAGVIDLDSNASLTSGGSVTLVVNTPTVISGAITGDPGYGSLTGGSSTMSLVKSGSAQLTLSGENQYLGDFTVAQGTLLLGGTGALGINDPDLFGVFSMNSLAVSSGGVLDLGGVTPAANTPLILSGTGAGSGALTNSGVDSATYGGSLTLAAASSIGGAGDITLGGSVASAYNLTKLGTNTLTFGGSSTFSGSLVVNGGIAQIGSAGTFEFASAGGLVGDLVNDGVLRFNNSADRTVTGAISGTGSLVKVGAYNLTLPGATYTGATTISAGSLTVKGALSTSQITNSGTFNWSPTTSVFTGSLSGTGKTILTSTSAVTLTLGTLGVTPTFDGNIQIGNNVTLSISAGVKLPGSIEVLSGGKLTLATGAGNVFGSTAKLTIDSGGSVDLKGNTVSFGTLTMVGGSLTSSGSVAAISDGTLTGGTTNISNVTLPGTVVITSTILAGGTFKQMAGGSLGGTFSSGTYSQILLQPTGGASITLDGTVNAGTSVIASSGSGAFTLQVQAPVLTPLFYIQSGVSATLLSGASLSTTGTLQVGGNVGLAGQSLAVGALSLSGGSITGGTLTAASIAAGTGTVTAVLSGSGTFTKTTSGTVTLSGANALSGLMDLQAGLVRLTGSGSLTTGSLNVSGATLDLGGVSRASGSLNLTGGSVTNGTLTAAAFNLQSGVVTGVLAGNATLSKTTPELVTLNGVNTLSGSVQVSAGTLQLGDGQSLAAASLIQITGGSLTFGGTVTAATLKSLAGNLSLNNVSGGSVTLTLANDAATTESGSLTGAGSLVKSGSGNLTLSGVNSYTGSTTVNSGILTTGTGALGNSAIVVNNGATLSAADFGLAAFLTVSGSGSATISNSGSYGAVANAGSVAFTGSGTTTLGSLSGAGQTRFSGSAILNGSGVSAGSVTATNNLKLNTLGGGFVSAGALEIGTLNGGNAVATTSATLSTMTAGSLTLNGAAATFSGSLNGGTISLSNAASLTVSTGSFSGTLLGTGTLNKNGNTAFTLNTVPANTVGINLKEGTLNAGNLLTGSRSITLAANTQLGVTLSTGTFSGTVTASDATSALRLSSSAPATLTLGSGATLAGSINLVSSGITLDLTGAGATPLASNSSLAFTGGDKLILGGSQSLELSTFTVQNGTLTIQSTGGTILYDTKPTFLALDTVTLTGGTSVIVGGTTILVQGSVTFDTLTQGGSIGTSGSYQYTAGRVQQRVNGVSVPVTGSVLYLEPKSSTTIVHINSGSFSEAILVGTGTHQGTVSVEGLVLAGSVGVGTGATLKLAQDGTLGTLLSGGSLRANITNSGSLQISVLDGSKTVANLISGTGSLEKIDVGRLVLSGSNTYSGNTVLTAGIVNMGGSLALGSGSISFNGGTLQYGFSGDGTDLSSRIANTTSGNKVVIDTNGNDVSFGAALGGAGGLLKYGTGKLTLNAANTFSGPASLQGGTLELAAAGSLAASSVDVASAGLLRFNRSDAASFAGGLSGAGAVEMVGSGALTLGGSWTGYTGVFSLSAGTLVLGSASALTGSGTLAFKGGVLQYGTGVTTDVSARFAALSDASARVNTNGNSVTFASPLTGTGGLVKSGSGNLTLAGSNTFSGATAVNAGTLTAGTGALANTSSITVSGASLKAADLNANASLSIDLAGSATVSNSGSYGTVSNSGVAAFNGGTVTLGSLSGAGATTFAGNARISTGSISGGSVAAVGSLQANVGGGIVSAASLAAGTLSGGSVTVTGGVSANLVSGGNVSVGGLAKLDQVSGGNLALNSGTISILNGGTVAVASTGTLTVNAGSSDSVISGSGSFVKDGSGALALNSAGGLAVTGKVTVNAGTLNVVDLAASQLKVNNGAQASISAAGSYGAVSNEGSVTFNGGTVAVTSLSGAGATTFAGNARVDTGSISGGSVTVTGSLQANVGGGTVSAATLGTGTLSGGSVAVSGAAAVNAVNGGVLTVTGSAALGVIGGGNVNLNGITSTVGTLNGGTVTVGSGGTLTVTSGGSAGAISGSGSLVKDTSATLGLTSLSLANVTVNGGTLNAGNTAISGLLTVASQGKFGASGNVSLVGGLANEGVVSLTASGTVNLGSLTGAGVTQFTNSGSIAGLGVVSGSVAAGNRLQLATLSGGSASAANLVLGSLTGGYATAGSAGTIGTMTAGSFTLNSGSASVASLAGGTIALSNTALLSVVSGSFSGSVTGTGTFSKTGDGTLNIINAEISNSINLSVLSGTLQATNGKSVTSTNVTLGAGGTLALTLQTGTYTGTVTATDKTAALNLSSTAPVTLSLSGSSAKLDGAITLANSGITLDFSNAGTSPFGSNASLIVSNGGTLALGTTDANRELNFNTVTLVGGSLTLSGTGKLLYDTKPGFLTDSNTLISGTNVIASSGISFDVLTQGALLSSGTYQYTAGRVQLAGGTLLTANQLLLDPKSAATTIRLAGGTFAQFIVAGGTSHQGTVSVEGLVYAGSLGIASGATTVLTDVGTLLVGTGSAAPTLITNSGTFQASSSSGIKTIANVIGGSGSFEKVGSGTLVLAGSSTYTGSTTLSNGLLAMSNSLSFGTLGSVVFKGGTLQYGSGVTTDLSSRISGSLSTSNFAIDTNGNNVAYGTALDGTVGLVKLGSGKLTLNAANTFSGSVSISAGTLELAAAGALAAANVDIASSSLLRFNRADAASFAVSFSGAGAIEKANTGALTLSGSGNGYTGIFSLSGGTLVLGNASALSGTLAFKGGVLQYGAGITTDISSGIAPLTGGSARIDTGTNSVTFSGSLSGTGGLVKSGAGNLTLSSGSNDFSGATVVNAGSLTTAAGALKGTPSIAVNGAVLNAVDFNSGAPLVVDVSGRAIVSGSGISTGAVTNLNSVSFVANTGKVTLAGLSGAGTTSFRSDAKINGGGVSQGKVTVDGSLQSAVAGGTVTAATFASDSVSGGSLTVSGSATIAAVSGGALTLNGVSNVIDALNGGNVSLANGVLTVQGGSTAGVVSGSGSLVKEGSSTLSTGAGGLTLTGGIIVNNGTLTAVDYASGLMTVGASGRLAVSGVGLSLGTLSNAGIANFTAATGTITLANLSGLGATQFAGNAILVSQLNNGFVTAGGRLQLPTLSGGSVTAANLVLGTLNSGQATATSTGSLGTLNGGSLNLTGAQFSVGVLSAGTVTLSSSAKLMASSGTFAGLISGSGTLVKDAGSTTLTLGNVPAETIAVSVLGGSLTAGNLLTGNRAVSVASGANLNLTLTTGSYSGSLTGLGTTLFGGSAGATLSLLSSASLDGALKLDGANTLNLSYGDTNKFGSNATLTITNGGSLIVGNSSQELELGSLTVSSGSLFLSGSGGKILYDNKPLFLGSYGDTVTLSSGTTLNVGSSTVTIVGGSVTFDVLTQGGTIEGKSDSYQYTAGRVQLKGGTAITASSLLLDPKLATTTIRVSTGTVTGSIVLGGTSHQGILSVEGTVTAGSLGVTSNTTAKFTQAGSLQTSAGTATAIANSGALQFSVTDGSKTVANLISGTGSVEKVDAGVLQLSGINTYSGNTVLSGGTAVLQNAQSFGTGSIVFNGGALQYGSATTTDLSSRIASLGSGTTAVVDTNGNLVTFATGLSGSGAFKKTANGILTLAGSNTFSGGLQIAAGTVQVGSGLNGSFASSATVDSGASLRFARTDSVTYSGALTGSGTVEQAGAGTLTLTGNNSSFAGTTVLSNGLLSVGTALALGTSGSVVFNGGVLQYGTGVATDLSAKISAVGSGKTATIDTNGNNVTYAAGLSGTGNFVKIGAGALTFNASNSLATTVKAGTLVYNGVSSGSVALTGGAVAYNLNGGTLSGNVVSTSGTTVSLSNTSGTLGTFSGVVYGAGSLLTSGNLSLNNSQKNTGGVTISSGSLTLGTGVSLGGSGAILSIASGATLDAVNGSLDSSSSLVLGNATSTLKLGEVTLSLRNFTLSTGTVLSATSSGAGANILVSGSISIGGTLQTSYISADGLVTVGTVSVGKSGFTSLTSNTGTLKGSVSGGSYDSLSTTVASNLKISSDINVLEGVNIGSGSLTLTSNLSAASVSIGSGSGGAALTVGSGASIKSDSVTFTSGTLKLSGSIGASTEGGGVVSFGGTSNAQAATVTLDSSAVITAKTVSFNSGSLTMSGSIAASGGDVSFGSASSGGVAAAITLSGTSASIAATKVKLNGGSNLTLSSDAVKALDNVKTLEIGGAGSSGTLTITSGTFKLASGNALKGSGKIVGSVNIGEGSALSPGNSPGTLTFSDAVAISSGGTLVLEHGQTISDHLSGTFNIANGGLIKIVDYDRSLLSGTLSYQPFDSGSVTAAGTVNVTVSVRLGSDTGTVGDTGVAYTTAESALYSANYSGGTISVTATSLAALAASNNLSGNALTVAKAVDSRLAALAVSGTFSVTAVDQIGTGATNAIARASLSAQLAAANPSGYSELAGLSTQRVLNLNQGIVDHFRSLRAGLLEPQDSNLTGWLSTYGSWQKQNGNSTQGTAGFSGNTWGSLFGVEKRVGDLTYGLNGAAGQTTADFQALTGHISTDAWHVGLYAVARMGSVVLESNALVGLTDTTARRTIAATGMTSREGKLSVKGTEWLFNTGAALPLIVPGSWTITPSARLVVQGQNQDGAKESDLSGLEVSLSRQNTTSVLHQAGVELRKQLSLAAKSAAASLNTDWIHNYNAKGRDLNMAFGSSPTSFGYKGSDSGADALRVSGAFEAALNERTTLRLSVDYQTMTRATSTNGSVSLGYAF